MGIITIDFGTSILSNNSWRVDARERERNGQAYIYIILLGQPKSRVII
jgi:hypothetical protein